MRLYRAILPILVMISLMVQLGGFNFTEEVRGLDQVNVDILITSDSALAASTYVRSGTGSASNPYLISDYNMTSRTIRIETTTSYLTIRNITFWSSSAWAFYFLNAQNIKVDNVSCRDRGRFIYSSGCTDITVQDSNVSMVTTDTYLVQVIVGTRVILTRNEFSRAPLSSGAKVYYEERGSGKRVLNCRFNKIPLEIRGFGGSGALENCTFSDSTAEIRGGDTGGAVRMNVFSNPGGDALSIRSSYRINVLNNFFRGTNGIIFREMQFQMNTVMGRINNNTFEKCGVGILNSNDFWNSATRFEVMGNYFGNSTGMAISWYNGQANRIWRNIFYHNAGTGDSGSSAQCGQNNVNNPKNTWTFNGQGNFWANHRAPDANNDGFVEVNYTINQGGLDTRPFTNPYFDTERPLLEMDQPSGKYLDRSYNVVRWTCSDGTSGIERVEASIDKKPAVDVTGKAGYSIWLSKGSHKIGLKAIDRAGLFALVERDAFLNDTYQAITFDYPQDGSFVPKGALNMRWTVKPYLFPANQSISLDGDRQFLSTSLRTLPVVLGEGVHRAELSIVDAFGMRLNRSANFTVDLTDPYVEMISPQPGSALSNKFVRINFLAKDNFAVMSVRVRMDGAEWADWTGKSSYNELLDDGPHAFDVEVKDRAGNVNLTSLHFTVGEAYGLRILSPLDWTATRNSTYPFSWEYNGTLDYKKVLLRVGTSGTFTDLAGAKIYSMLLANEGEYLITCRLEDAFENYVEKSVTLIRDNRPPAIQFVMPMEGAYLNTTSVVFAWVGHDNSGLEIVRYQIMVDSGEWTDVGRSNGTTLELTQGEHIVTLRGFDAAGNPGQIEMTITVDTTPPEVVLTEPRNGAFRKDISVDVRWSSKDNVLLANLTLFLDGSVNYDVTGRSSYTLLIGLDGPHSIRLVAQDAAMNIRSTESQFFIDLNAPKLSWAVPLPQFTNSSKVNVSWSVIEAVGLFNITLEIGGSSITVGNDRTWIEVDLEEGTYPVKLTAIDLAGWVSELRAKEDLVVDTTPPELIFDMSGIKVAGTRIEVTWSSNDELSGLVPANISLDGGFPEQALRPGTFVFENVLPGTHTIEILLRDRAGNQVASTVTFDVAKEDDGGDDDGGGVSLIAVIAVIGALLVMVLAGIGIFISVRRKNRTREEIKKAIGPVVLSPSLPVQTQVATLPVNDRQALPPPTPTKQEETMEGHGYIRPAQQKQRTLQDQKAPEIPAPAKSPVENAPPGPASEPLAPPKVEEKPLGMEEDIPEWGDDEAVPAPGPVEGKGPQ